MKRITITLCAAVLLFACNDDKNGETKVASANTNDSTATPPMPDSATMMKNWQAYMTPGQPHQMIASWNGTWNGDVSMWMAPGAPPSKSTSTTTNKMALGGRYQISEHKGSFDGMPFEGMSTLAYDNAKKMFISTWIDNMGTGIMVVQGPWNEATKSMDLKGKMTDPNTGNDIDVRETFKVVDDNTQVMEMYCNGADGKNSRRWRYDTRGRRDDRESASVNRQS